MSTPLVIAQQTDRKRAEARERVLLARRADSARHGYRGPLTRAEAANSEPVSAAQRRASRFRPMGVR